MSDIPASEFYNTIIIGGGQAGLAAAHHLQKRKKDFVILEASPEVGHSWKNRYDSLKLFTSARYNSLPGLRFPGNQDRFPTKDEVVKYLKDYASTFQLPVSFDTRVLSVNKAGDSFLVSTTRGLLRARNVIVCTGAFQKPFIPSFSEQLSPSILQLHSSVYSRPSQLKEGDTLIVGGGNSGVQIAEEILEEVGKAYFSFSGSLKAMPNNKLTQFLVFGCGLASASISSPIGNWLRNRPEPVMGTNLKELFANSGLGLVGRTIGGNGNDVFCENGTLDSIQNVIWATGFKPDFSWIGADIFNKAGYPEHVRGVTRMEGLYFLGLPWMYSRFSGLLGGVGKDAAYIVNHLN